LDVTEGDLVMAVMIGIDPHKASDTAVAIDPAEVGLGELRVRAGDEQLERFLAWAKRWPERTWAIENARGLGYLLAHQLIAVGERVLDVPPKLAARVRLLNTRRHQQKRSQRCPVGGHRGLEVAPGAVGVGRRSHRHHEAVDQAPPRAERRPHQGRVPAARRVV
jgi:hypothetical protein